MHVRFRIQTNISNPRGLSPIVLSLPPNRFLYWPAPTPFRTNDTSIHSVTVQNVCKGEVPSSLAVNPVVKACPFLERWDSLRTPNRKSWLLGSSNSEQSNNINALSNVSKQRTRRKQPISLPPSKQTLLAPVRFASQNSYNRCEPLELFRVQT